MPRERIGQAVEFVSHRWARTSPSAAAFGKRWPRRACSTRKARLLSLDLRPAANRILNYVTA